MNVLLAANGIFAEIGGGQRFYANLVAANPRIQFYFFGNEEACRLPPNAHPLRLGVAYRRQADDFVLNQVPADNPAAAIGGHGGELALLMDMAAAAAVPAVHFDIVDIPDFLPFAVYLPECLSYFGARWDRLALSLHGTLSMALFDNWNDDIGGLQALVEHEELLYRCADLRYGISQRYVDEWSRKTGLPTQLLDIGRIYQWPQPAKSPDLQPGTPPDLCFVGRQEKWKGPDLFVQLCAQLPRPAYRRIRLLGPEVDIHGHRSMAVLRKLAANRGLDLIHEVVPPERMAARLREDRIVVVLPSRRDPFNLVALEALLQGCPTAVSTACGACDYLDQAYPGLPYVRFNPEDPADAAAAVMSLLTGYDAARDRLADYLEQAQRQDYGAESAQAYAAGNAPDRRARQLVGERFAGFAAWLAAEFQPRAAAALATRVERCCAEILASQQCTVIAPAMAAHECRRALEINRIAAPALAARDDASWAELDEARGHLDQHVFGGSRVALYRLMAEWERRRGNELLYATYWLRVMRLSGEMPPPVLREVRAILGDHGFQEEAYAAELLHRDDEEEIHRYLKNRADRLLTTPCGGVAAVTEFARPREPRVSVIVSVYRAADKIDTFVSGLERFTEEAKRISEFVFVDSASPDDTQTVLTERLRLAATRGVGSLYLRTEERETIQRAWNRGIAAARGGYLAFLGVDEMNRPDAIAKMADFLDHHPAIDWVQGSAVITEVNAAGSYLRDVMAYDRRFDSRHIHYLECCYVSYVGALYRKAIHDRVGPYDDRFRAAGDTEFKNRALPLIGVETLPETFGTFLNYPEERTTQSPVAELEDLRAWYLHRSPGGVRYAFESAEDVECIRQFRRALGYKKSYMDGICSDVDYALAIAAYAKCHRPAVFAAIEPFLPNLIGLQLAYRRLDLLVPADRRADVESIADGLGEALFAIAQAQRVHRQLGLPAEYRITNDNRWHQHHLLWQSRAAANIAPNTAQAAPDERANGLEDPVSQAVEAIEHGEPIAARNLGALCAVATADGGNERLDALAARAVGPGNGKSLDRVLADVRAVVASYLGTADGRVAIFSPALPFDVVDADGRVLPGESERSLRQRGESWRVTLPAAQERQWLRIRLDPSLAVPGHPGLIGCAGFYPVEGEAAGFRWTGPGTSSTIVLPLAVTTPARVTFELDATGDNSAAEDFSVAYNGTVVPHEIDRQDQITLLSAELSPSFLTGPCTELTFTIRECSRAQFPDRRILGVVFRSLTLLLGPPVDFVDSEPRSTADAVPA